VTLLPRVTEPGAVLESAKSGAGGSTTWPIGLLVSVLFRRIGLLVSVLLSAKKENNWCQFCFQRKTELTPIIDTNYPPRMHSEMMKGYNRADERAKAVVAEVRAIASEVGWSPAQVALAWLRQRPMSVIPIVGARRLEQFKDNLACLDLTLDGLQVKRLDSASHVESGFPHDLYERDLVKGSSMARCETRSTCDPNRAAGTDGQHVPLHEQDIEEASSLFDVNIKGGVLPHVHEVRDRADAQDRRRGDREHVVDLRAQRLPWLVAVHGHEARRHRHDQGGGAGRRRAGHPGGCGRLRLGGDAPAGEGDRRRPSWLRRLRSEGADRPARRHRRSRRPAPVRRGPVRHRPHAARRWWRLLAVTCDNAIRP